MVVYRNEVSHQWARHRLLEQWRSGAVAKDAVCDASFLLVTAARFHGHPAGKTCPVCESDELRLVFWVFGDSLGKASNTARNKEEIAAFAESGHDVTVHTVEVCTACRWNHLLMANTVSAA